MYAQGHVACAVHRNDIWVSIILKQRVLQVRDEKTRTNTAFDKKPGSSQGVPNRHGVVRLHAWNLVASYALITAYATLAVACATTVHRGALLWMQHLYWGKGRPMLTPKTLVFY